MITVDQLDRLRKKVSNAKLERARIEGQLSALMADLYTRFGVKSVVEADNRLVELETEEAMAKKKFEDQLKALEDKYGKFLF